MKRIICLILFVGLLFTSCEYFHCCPYCNGIGCRYCYGYTYYHNNSHKHYDSDYFCGETLLGVWQMEYPSYVGTMELRQIRFIDDYKCDITYSFVNDVDWYTHTYTYCYSNGYVRFTRNRNTFSFKVEKYTYPTLLLSDSFGTYTWKKVRNNY